MLPLFWQPKRVKRSRKLPVTSPRKLRRTQSKAKPGEKTNASGPLRLRVNRRPKARALTKFVSETLRKFNEEMMPEFFAGAQLLQFA